MRERGERTEGGLPQPVPPRHLDDPYPYYETLRRSGAVQRSADGQVLVLGHAELSAALRDPSFVRSPPPGTTAPPEGDGWFDWLVAQCATAEGRRATVGLSRLWMINLDPPAHPPLRRAAVGGLSTPVLASLRPLVESTVAALLDDMERRVRRDGRHVTDLMDEFALPLPARVIAALLGVPEADRPRTIELARSLGPAIAGETGSAEERRAAIDRASAATVELAAAFRSLVRGAAGPPAGLLAHLAAAGLGEAQIVSQAMLLFFAGEETTAHWIGNGVAALLAHAPAGTEPLRDHGSRAVALEELLRFDSPVQFTFRRSLGGAVGGVPVPEGDYLVLMLGAANRDPSRFDDPATLRLDRTPNPHLSFGSGLHGCVGAGLARLEAEVAFGALFERFPGLRADGASRRRPGALLRGLDRLPVKLSPDAAR